MYLIVLILYTLEVWHHKRHLVGLPEETDRPRVVQSGHQHLQQIIQQHRLVVQVELDRLIVQLNIRHLQQRINISALNYNQ